MQEISIVVDVREKIFKICEDEKFLSWKWPQANPNLEVPRSKFNPNPKFKARVRVGVNYWKNDNRWASETKCKRLVSS